MWISVEDIFLLFHIPIIPMLKVGIGGRVLASVILGLDIIVSNLFFPLKIYSHFYCCCSTLRRCSIYGVTFTITLNLP
jgi:hypothetical protein